MRVLVPCVVAAFWLAAADVRADEPAVGRDAPADAGGRAGAPSSAPSEEPPAGARGGGRWQPHWDRFDAGGAVLIVVAESAAWAVYLTEPVTEPRWTEPLPLDPEVRDGLRLAQHEERSAAVVASDAMLMVMLAWPIVVDSFLLAGLVHGDSDVALQMALIDLETLAVAHMVTWLTSRLSGRIRPEAIDCYDDDRCGDPGVGPVASFVGGHSVMTYASAGLICTHHLENPWLLGGLAGAGIACAGGLAVATATSFLRLNADRHWASDVAIGAALGAAIGFGIPFAMHYARPRPSGSARARADDAPSIRIAVRPGAGSELQGLTVIGAF